MVKILIVLFFLSSSASAKEGIIRVLEAPLFSEPDELSNVVQHVRKGEYVYLHPSTFKNQKYDYLREKGKTNKQIIDESYDEHLQEYPDAFFDDEFYNYDKNDRFYKTLTKRKRPAFILKKHVTVLFEDKRELFEKKLEYDATDYRISEPLPDNYPIKKKTGYKGHISLGVAPSSRSSYSYPGSASNESSSNALDVQAVWSSIVKLDELRRLYFGAIVNYNRVKKTISLADRSASETYTRFGAGPYLSYDVWKDTKQVWTAYIGMTLNLLNTLDIKQQSASLNSSGEFRSFSLTAKIGAYYKKKDFFMKNLDFMAGFNIDASPPTKFSGSNDGVNPAWWSQDDFSSKFFVEASGFIGIQSDY